MKDDELQNIITSISDKVGNENSALIADDLGKLITMNSQVIDDLNKKDNEISRLTSTNEKLVLANGNLLQSIPIGKEEKKQEEEEYKPFNFRSLFDDKGNMKR